MRVLIVSSYKVSCGIATYTEALETLLGKDFDVTVAALDQSILRSQIPHVDAAGDRQIRDLCATFKDYDAVNFQWEPGLLGIEGRQMTRRLEMILEAAPNLILTVHTAVPYPGRRGLLPLLKLVRARGALGAYRYFFDAQHRYLKETHRVLAERARSGKNTAIAVHTRREKEFFQNVVGFRDVFDHPLSLIHADWPARLAEDAPRARRELERMFPGKRRFVGVFGFLSEYKGIVTALNAMKLMGEDHQLVIYGGVHPEALKPHEPVNGYVRRLIEQIEGDAPRAKPAAGAAAGADALGTWPDEEPDAAGQADGYADEAYGAPAPLPVAPRAAPARGASADTLLEKVAFLGAPDDYEFALAMATVDVCVFPYLEVGQSGSGPLSIAVELGKPTIASRTRAFIEFARYHPRHFEMIDVGNHIQLAQTLQRFARVPPEAPEASYDRGTLAAFYGRLIRSVAGRDASPRSAERVGEAAGQGREQGSAEPARRSAA